MTKGIVKEIRSKIDDFKKQKTVEKMQNENKSSELDLEINKDLLNMYRKTKTLDSNTNNNANLNTISFGKEANTSESTNNLLNRNSAKELKDEKNINGKYQDNNDTGKKYLNLNQRRESESEINNNLRNLNAIGSITNLTSVNTINVPNNSTNDNKNLKQKFTNFLDFDLNRDKERESNVNNTNANVRNRFQIDEENKSRDYSVSHSPHFKNAQTNENEEVRIGSRNANANTVKKTFLIPFDTFDNKRDHSEDKRRKIENKKAMLLDSIVQGSRQKNKSEFDIGVASSHSNRSDDRNKSNQNKIKDKIKSFVSQIDNLSIGPKPKKPSTIETPIVANKTNTISTIDYYSNTNTNSTYTTKAKEPERRSFITFSSPGNERITNTSTNTNNNINNFYNKYQSIGLLSSNSTTKKANKECKIQIF